MTRTPSTPLPSAEGDAHAAPAPTGPLSRRRMVVAGVGGVASVGLLSACGGGSTATAPAAPATAAPSSEAASGANALTSTADVPVGGGTVLADQDVVVTQPTAGEFRAFSATCTHQGCKVGRVEGGAIICPCHGSRFAVADGSVLAGPATAPLPEKAVSVEGTSVVLT